MNEPENKSPAIPASTKPEVKFVPVKFIHEKGSRFKTYHADGAWGVVNALNEIHLNIFTEYPRLATGVINQVNPADGTYTGEFQMLGADPNYNEVVRDFQCNIVLSIAVADRIHKLLGDFIKIAQDRKAADEKNVRAVRKE